MPDLVRFVRRHRIDLLHLDGRPGFPFGRLAARLSRRPTLAHLHAMLPMPLPREILSRLPWFSASRAIAVSAAVRTWALDWLPIAPDRVEVLYNGHDFERFAFPPADARERVRGELGLGLDLPVIGLIGRLDFGQKGQDVMVRALPKVHERHPDARLLVVGDGPDLRRCKALAASSDLTGAVVFAGYRHDIEAVLAAVDVVVVPSTCEEGLALVALEALAAGRPVIASQSGGLIEVVLHGDTGLVVPKGNSIALGEAVSRLLDDSALARRLGANGRKLARRFSLESHVERLTAIYEAMVPRAEQGTGRER